MSRPRILVASIGLVLMASLAFAESTEKKAAALIEHAKQFSDIRAAGSPAFRLKENIKIVFDDGTVGDGTYAETWASPEIWRTEIAAGAFSQVEVVKDRKLSILSNVPLVADFISPRITSAHELLLGFHMNSNWFVLDYKPSRIEE
jgi:hypothetical protein